MLSQYHKNTVMHGCLDYFCLACESHLKTDEDVNLHIEKPVHKKNLGLAQYVDSCENDRIRKVNKRYYCEYCNILLATIPKVKLHVKEDKHDFNKTDETGGDIKKSVFLKWIKNAVIAFDDLLIDERAWNGFVDETCVICESEFDNAAMHRSEVGHLLKLVQAKVQVGSDNFISRKIDDTTYQCLTCNTVLPHIEMINHYDKPEHTKLYLQCRKAKRALMTIETKDEQKAVMKKNAETKKKEEPKKDEPKKEEPKKEEPKKEKPKKEEPKKEEPKKEESKKEEPKKIEMVDKKETKKTVKQDAETSDKTPAKSEVIPKLDEEETVSPYDRDVNKVLGTSQYLKFLPGNSVLCLLCDWYIDLFSISQHVQGAHHHTLQCMQETRAAEMRKLQKTTQKTSKEVPEEKIEKKPAVDEGNKTKIIDSIQNFQKKDILIDLISEKAFCKRCSANVEYVFDDIEKHIEGHKNSNIQSKTTAEKYPTADKDLNKTEVKRPEPEKSKTAAKENKPLPPVDIETYAKSNEITYNKTHNKAYCRLCETKVPSTLKCLQEHVQGNNHQQKKNKPQEELVVASKAHKEDSLYETKSMADFINSLTVVENLIRQDCVINEDICISFASFMMYTKIEKGKFRCQMCEKTLQESDLVDHRYTKKHEKLVMSTKVLYTIDDELIREVRPELFHCGFCNQVEAGWSSLQMHLLSTSHEHIKHSCEWMLQEHMSAIREHRVRKQQAEFMFIMRLLMGRPF